MNCLRCENGAKILVFTETKRKCDELTRYLFSLDLYGMMNFFTICQSHDFQLIT